MAEWKQLHPAITGVVQKLPESAYLAMRNNACLMQFARVEVAEDHVLRAEVCRDSVEDEPRLRTKGWELVDSWSGLWRRDIPGGSDGDAVSALVLEAIAALRMSGVRDPDGFTYLSWQEAPPKAGWQFWKAGKDKELTWPDLGLRPGKDQGD
ncbi:MAG: TY-Chap domain-containing protein [Arachnia sp.]